jgi:hypothetical protein
MNRILQLPISAVSQAYPNLTPTNHKELVTLLESLHMTVIDQGSFPSAASDWPIISPKGNSNSVCNRNVLSIGGDKSSFYKQRWQNVYTLEEASVYLLDYYERCKHITKLGVLLTDVWRPSTLSRWSHIYEMYETMGIQSVALLYSGHQITPIRWPWR